MSVHQRHDDAFGRGGVCLNYHRDWAEVGSIVTDADAKPRPAVVRDAFLHGQAEKVPLSKGTKLYKFNGWPSLAGKSDLDAIGTGGAGVSPWWSPYEPYRHDPGWIQKQATAKHFGVSVREWGRITSAVRQDWNSLEYLLVITLKHDAYGFFGEFSAMPKIGGGASKVKAGEGDGLGLQKTLGSRTGSQWMIGRTEKLLFTSPGMAERIAAYGTKGRLSGGGTQFYIPNIRVFNVASWHVEDLTAV
jgi:hypothetical protein